jgi:hypothetical protein
MAMALIQMIIYQMTMTKKLTTTIPPKRGPNPQGLNIPLKQVKTSNTPENINGRYRQIVTKRKNIDRG